MTAVTPVTPAGRPVSRVVARAAAVAALLCSVAAVGVMVADGRAGALGQDRITVTPDAPVTVQFGPLTPGGIGTTADTRLFVGPVECATSTYCDAIPITVDPGDLDEDVAEWFLVLTTSWDTQVVPVPVAGDVSVNDLDTYLFNDPIVEDAGEDANGIVASGATGGQPETITLRNPGRGDYTLTVSNYNGANTGYSVTAEFQVELYPTVFESLPPDASGGPAPVRPPTGGGATPSRPAAPPSFPGVPDPAFGPPPPPVADLSLGGSAPDAAFDEGFEDTADAFGDALAAPPRVVVNADPVAETFAPPSDLALALWLVAAPLALVAVGAGLLSRRTRRIALPI